ncbi:DUF3667 domain-containing protein [Sphingomonas sp.]|uniref:DUF3667 domain-containing protein n=1 Tax=Sphingomonas sp. TaxID=28214 RepID=UPI00286AECFC|nr:DUF3667 domain-containing protein [Sphingomonas sp.]
MSELDSVGEMVTGGLIAGAVEPGTGAGGTRGHGACPNCGTMLTGAYCSECGQRAQLHRSLRSFFGDFAAGLFNFEGKIWRTIPLLAWKPGELTRRYIAGERARFVSPAALYLFTVFAMFAVLSFTGALSNGGGVNLTIAVQEEQAALVKLGVDRAAALKRGSDVAALDSRIAKKKADIAQLEGIQSGAVIKTDEGDEIPGWMSGAVAGVQADPKGSMRDVQDATSKYSWLLIPLSVPFVWLLFPFRRRYRMYDHAVFVTYSLSFMMFLVIVGGLLVWAGMPALGALLTLIPPFHMYRQLKGAYQLGRLSALLRTIALVTFAFIVVTFFAMAVAAIGLL